MATLVEKAILALPGVIAGTFIAGVEPIDKGPGRQAKKAPGAGRDLPDGAGRRPGSMFRAQVKPPGERLPMPKIVITAEANAAIESVSDVPLADSGRQLPNGDWELDLSDEAAERLASIRSSQETDSDLIIRLAAFYKSGGKLN
jgi:hypothetical protein